MSIWVDKADRRHVGVMQGGKRVHRILPPGASASDAKRIEAEIRSAIGRRSVAIPGDPLLTEVMSAYMAHANSLRSPKTAKGHAVRLGPWLEGHRASEVRQAVSAAIADMSSAYKPATINRSIGALKKALRLAWESGRTPVDYSTTIKRLPEHNARAVYLTPNQVAKLADRCSGPVRAAVWIALLTGMRRGEICKLTREDIGRDALTIKAGNTKTLRTRIVPIVPALRPWLAHIPLAVNFEGLKSGFRRAREAACMPHVRFHDLRHSCASILINAKVPLEVVRDILGHTSVKTTERYAHLKTSSSRDALRKLGAKITPAITQGKKKALRKSA